MEKDQETISEEYPDTPDEEEKSTDPEWEARTLCSDESCIGVIGPDGRCKECGLPYDGELPAPPAPAEADAGEESAPAETPESAPEVREDEPVDPDEETDAEWENRRLCSDESCIGVIGPDNRCKECGRPYEP